MGLGAQGVGLQAYACGPWASTLALGVGLEGWSFWVSGVRFRTDGVRIRLPG